MPLNKSFKVKSQQRSAIIDWSDFDEVVVLDCFVVEVILSLRPAEVDEQQSPSPLVSYRALLASPLTYSERNRRHSTCRDLVGREPRCEIRIKFYISVKLSLKK